MKKKALLFIPVFALTLAGFLFLLFRDYTVTMDLGDGREVVTQKFNALSGDIALDNPRRDGYRFTGWTGSNGTEPQTGIVISAGSVGDRHYTANWDERLRVTCEDWLIDSYGNRVENITTQVDGFLAKGESTGKYQVVERMKERFAGDHISPEEWGKDKSYKAYHAEYMLIGHSGRVKVLQDGLTIYRHFYVVLDVNSKVDDDNTKDIVTFDVYVNGTRVVDDVTDFCNGIPYGAEYEIRDIRPAEGYRYNGEDPITGSCDENRRNVTLDVMSSPDEQPEDGN